MSNRLRALLGSTLVYAQIACAFDAGGSGSAVTGVGGDGSSAGEGGPSTNAGTSGPNDSGAAASEAGPGGSTVPATAGTGEVTGDAASSSSSTALAGTSTETTAPASEGAEASTTGAMQPTYYSDCADDLECGPGGECKTFYVDLEQLGNVCYLPCDDDHPCPAPDAEADAICTLSGCALDCAGGQSCPDGMVCGYTSENARRCIWP